MWDHPQQEAMDKLKQAVMSTPVLRYYNIQEEVTLQCDALQSGLGAAMMQNGKPVVYASRALTSAETRYAQIEKSSWRWYLRVIILTHIFMGAAE